ncbi:universal stress protein [Maribacter hydrothermalis]|uniref:UspA domain-containing protein n=1 Tax=Maribacter hydrothermalis TaxID=1836467 RepID=A0A1B7YZ54_9FLAO|nr:universal stress protein [Maribacter hydrothermalis]APQ16147.1 hypothetical protein BTR34_01745 [Maribacter hydrothermalis]OBR35676.1 hypothetical protein A9200_10770 [Maribacter hydrothermalis]
MKKIILTTDFSENAWNAIFNALKLYEGVTCHFYLLHAYTPTNLNMLGAKSQQRLGVIYDSLSKYSEQELEGMFSYFQINHKNPKHTFTTVSKAGILEEVVEKLAIEEDIDLIIMGTQGATGAKEIFLGSNAVRVIKTIKNIPIITMPSGFNFLKLNTIHFGTNFSTPYKKSELEPIIELSKLWKSTIEIIHVSVENSLNDSQKANKEILKERLLGLSYQFKTIPFEISISKSLDIYLENKTSSILSLIRHQHTFWEKVLGEAVVKKIAFHADLPVLFLPQ